MKRLLILAALASIVSGCVVVPAADYDRHYRGDRYWDHRYERQYGYDPRWDYYGYNRHEGSY